MEKAAVIVDMQSLCAGAVLGASSAVLNGVKPVRTRERAPGLREHEHVAARPAVLDISYDAIGGWLVRFAYCEPISAWTFAVASWRRLHF